MIKETLVQTIQNIINTREIKSSKQITRKIGLNKDFTDFLNSEYPNVQLKEQCWLLINNSTKEEHTCEACGNLTNFQNWFQGYGKFCSISCATKNTISKSVYHNERKLPILTKNCIICNKEFKSKKVLKLCCSHKCAAIFRVNNTTNEQRQISQEKREQTCLKKYGNKHLVASDIIRNKIEEKTGFRYTWQNPKILQDIKDRHKEKYGVENPLQRPEILEKMINTRITKYGDLLAQCYSYKPFTFPSGRIIQTQGYEIKALEILLQKYSEDDIIHGKSITKLTGPFKYLGEDNKMHYYYPDIFIISENRIIEVKSSFTFSMHKNTNDLKRKSVEDKGFSFEFMIL